MEKGPQQIVLKSFYNPDQLKIHNLFAQCGVRLDAKTFLSVWKLCDLGVPPHATIALLRDIAKYSCPKKKSWTSQPNAES